MPEADLCLSCSGWLCDPEDAWCGSCGAGCAQASLKIEPDVMQLNNIAPRLEFTITNRSCADLPLQKIDLPDWIQASSLPSSIAPGATVCFPGRARTMDLKTPQGGTIAVHLGPGKAETVAMAIDETPVLTCMPSELELWGSGRKRVELAIAPKAGLLRIRAIHRGPLGDVEILSAFEQGMLASPGKGAPVVLQMDVERFRQRPAASLEVEFDSPHGTRRVEIRPTIFVRNAPQVRWEGENEAPAKRFAAIGQRLDIEIANKAPDGRDGGAKNASLVIESARLEPPKPLGDVPIRLHSPLPLTLRGGESAILNFEADLTAIPPSVAPLSFRLVVNSNSPVLDKRVPVLVGALPEFDGVLAIDFGSSNTCAAVVETGREYEMLALDDTHEVSPTVVWYRDLTGPVPEVETGARVKENAHLSAQYAASTASRLKQRLGDRDQNIPIRPYSAADWTTRTATLAAADYLRELRRTVERSRQAVFRHFLLTHPAVCSWRQYRNLKKALKLAFGDTALEVRFLQEPIAALVPFFADQAEKTEPRTYTVASFDLGGGTTDVSVVRVENRPAPAGRMVIRPVILYSRGFRFGGEDLTDFLKSHLEWRVEAILKEQNPGSTLIRKGVSGASSEDILRNEFAIRSIAESFKTALSEAGTKANLRSIRFWVQSASDLSSNEYAIDVADLFGSGYGELKPVFTKEVRERVQGVARYLSEAQQRLGKLDYIQLSGMTSYLPEVGACIREMFPEANVTRARDPKECVVKGACLSRAMSRGAARYLALPEAVDRTTSSIGLYDVTAALFTTILPVDTSIPSEGLTGEIPEAWFGSERVALWENLGVSDDELRADGTRSLSKLGTWQPEGKSEAARLTGWTLRVSLRSFELEVTALGPHGEVIKFRFLDEAGVAGGHA